MTTATRWDTIEHMVKTYGLGRAGTNDETAGTTAILSDDSQFGGHRGANGFDVGDDVRAKQDGTVGGGGTVTYDTTRLSKRPSFAAGTITVDPVFALGETPDAGDNDTTFLVLRQPFRFEDIDYALDKVLGVGGAIPWERRIVPVTLAVDGDMRSSGTSLWESSAATVTKVAASFPLGERALRIAATSAGGNANSLTLIPVEPGKSYYFEVTANIASTGAADDIGELLLTDVTNVAAITLTNVDVTRFEPVILQNQSVEMPSGCKEVEIKMTCTASGDIIDLSNVIFRKNESTVFTLPDIPVRILDIGEVKATTRDTWSRRDWDTMTPIRATPRQLDSGLWELHLRQSVAGMSVWYEEFAVPGTLASDAATTNVPKEFVAAVAAYELLKAHRDNKEWASAYLSAAEDTARVMTRYATQRVIIEEGSSGLFLPSV